MASCAIFWAPQSLYIAFAIFLPVVSVASDAKNILDYSPTGSKVDRTGYADASKALAGAIAAANGKTAVGEPACVYIPAGIYKIASPPPPFVKAGCVKGDGPTQSTLSIDLDFEGDLFAWSEAWMPTAPGPTVIGLRIIGNRSATRKQNALVFYDRNDEVFVDNVEVSNLHGRALYSGITKNAQQAYMRESHLRSLRFFGDGAPGIPVVEFNSQGSGIVDATNAIRLFQVDIYGARGPGLVIRNNGNGAVRGITIEALRIEGSEDGTSVGDLLTIGDPVMSGNVNNVFLTDFELIDPAKGFAALRLTAAKGAPPPYQISGRGSIGGGIPMGFGLRIDAGRQSSFQFSGIHTLDTNIVIGSGVSEIYLDGYGQETGWTYKIDPSSANALHVPVYRNAMPAVEKPN